MVSLTSFLSNDQICDLADLDGLVLRDGKENEEMHKYCKTHAVQVEIVDECTTRYHFDAEGGMMVTAGEEEGEHVWATFKL